MWGFRGASCAAEVLGWAGYRAECLCLRKGGQLGDKNLVFPSEMPKTLLVSHPVLHSKGDVVLSSCWVEN